MPLAPMHTALLALEEEAADNARAADPLDDLTVYGWRPLSAPALPAIWNWIEDGTYEVGDTATSDDVLIVRATIAVDPADTPDRLLRLADHVRAVIDPALWTRRPLDGTAKLAKRMVTRMSTDTVGGVEALCLDLLIRVELTHPI